MVTCIRSFDAQLNLQVGDREAHVGHLIRAQFVVENEETTRNRKYQNVNVNSPIFGNAQLGVDEGGQVRGQLPARLSANAANVAELNLCAGFGRAGERHKLVRQQVRDAKLNVQNRSEFDLTHTFSSLPDNSSHFFDSLARKSAGIWARAKFVYTSRRGISTRRIEGRFESAVDFDHPYELRWGSSLGLSIQTLQDNFPLIRVYFVVWKVAAEKRGGPSSSKVTHSDFISSSLIRLWLFEHCR